MPIRAQCSAGHVMMVPDHRAGTTLRCPRCGIDVAVPGTKSSALAATLATATTPLEVKPPAESSPQAPREAEGAPARASKTTAGNPPWKKKLAAEHVEKMPADQPIVALVAPSLPSPAPSHRVVLTESALLAEPPPLPPAEQGLSKPATAAALPPPLPSRSPPKQTAPEVSLPVAPADDALSPTVAEKSEPPAARRPAMPLDRHQQATALLLGALVCGLAIFSMVPAVWEAVAVWQSVQRVTTPPWVYAMAALGIIQFAYGLYLMQLPDWSVLWTATIAQLAGAATYALLLGVTLFARGENAVVMLFGYSDKVPGNRAAMWCMIMLCFTSVTVYALGFTASRWYRAYRVRRELA